MLSRSQPVFPNACAFVRFHLDSHLQIAALASHSTHRVAFALLQALQRGSVDDVVALFAANAVYLASIGAARALSFLVL